jgi:glycosyltransferase involved in cell wall biosynthesis
MKICLIGIFSGDLEEGYRNIAFNLSEKLSREHDVLNMDVKEIFSTYFWRKIKDFNPHIIHYFTAPTLSSFIALKFAKIYSNSDTKLVISSLHPYALKLLRKPVLKKCIPLLKPDLILTQSYEVEKILSDLNCNTKFLPNGVDTERFIPVSVKMKERLREKYEIAKEKFVILHVGHLRGVRGLQIFNKLQREDKNTQVIIVSSSYFRTDKKLRHDLVKNGCIVWDKYFEKIEEVYALSDCYVFPAILGSSIFMPLSVLEAMSCNLPVISTKFEGLSKSFEDEGGLFFAEKKEDLLKRLREVRSEDLKVDTRRKVLPYSWELVGKRLKLIYNDLLSGE